MRIEGQDKDGHVSPTKRVRRIAIHQPNYAPWAGYFSKMAFVDAFVFLDNCQMPNGRSYVSRVKVRKREGVEWMTVPVQRVSGQPINAVQFAGDMWARRHLSQMRESYGRCPFYESVMAMVRPIYEDPGEYLAPFNMRLIRVLASYAGLTPCLYLASELSTARTGTQRLVEIVQEVGGTVYVSGLGGRNYQEPAAFEEAGIQLEIRVYHPALVGQHKDDCLLGLSMLDALFHLGPAARKLLSYVPAIAAQTSAEVPGRP